MHKMTRIQLFINTEYWTVHKITKGAQSHKVNKSMELILNNKFIKYQIACIKWWEYNFFIIDEASSLTLVDGLAPHDNKRHHNINWIHEK